MQVHEGQRLGSLMLLIAALFVYGLFFFHQYWHFPQKYLPWGNHVSGTMAVEVSGTKGTDGIYFLPVSMSWGMIKKVIGVGGEMIQPPSDDTSLYHHTALTITVERGIMKISDMYAAKRLALGLPIDLNNASVEELSFVPGIGKRLAVSIIQLRLARGKIVSLEDLTTIPGIKEKKLSSLKKYLTVESNP